MWSRWDDFGALSGGAGRYSWAMRCVVTAATGPPGARKVQANFGSARVKGGMALGKENNCAKRFSVFGGRMWQKPVRKRQIMLRKTRT